jgi:hypothetical protein
MSRQLKEEYLEARALGTGMVVRLRTFFHPFKGEDFVVVKVVLKREVTLTLRDKRGQYDTKKLKPNREVPYWRYWSGEKFETFICPHLDKTASDCHCLRFK